MYYTNGNKKIYASDKAYELLYKGLGYYPVDEKIERREPEQASETKDEKEEKSFKELRAEAKELGVEGYGKMKTEELIAAIEAKKGEQGADQ